MLDRDTVLKLLADMELFASVRRTELEALLSRSAQKQLEPPAQIFAQGDLPDAAYIVLTGEVRIVSVSFEGNTLVHLQVAPGQMFGEIAVLDQGPRTSGATVAQPCELLAIPSAQFIRLLECNGPASLHLARLLAQRTRSTSQGLEDALFLSARMRVAKKLAELAQSQGRRRADSVALENMTHEALANLVGLHRVTVTNQIAHLEREGLLRSERGRLVLLDLERLDAFSSSAAPRRREPPDPEPPTTRRPGRA
jgi:CRP-like cAMP-binding protein